jgi:predicted ATP-grasp superfamily ATP-dependent carboligase
MRNPIRTLAIVGASARAAAFSAIRAGYNVVAADLFADADLARVAPVTRIDRYPWGLVDWLAKTECNAWMYTGAIENYPGLVDRMAELRPLAGNCGAVLRDVRDPMKLQAACVAAGVPFPETRSAAKGLPIDGSWLCKTYRGAGGTGVWRLDSALAVDHAFQRRATFQRHVAGAPYAALFVVARDGANLWGVTRQLLNRRRPWQYAGSMGPAQVSREVLAQLVAAGKVLRRFGLSGLVGVDLVISSNSAYVVEVNPRLPASAEIVERLVGRSAVAAHVEACGSSSIAHRTPVAEFMPQGRSHYAKKILYARRDVIVTPILHHWAMTHSSLDPMYRALADIPRAGEVVPAGRPVFTVLATGYSPSDCQQRLGQRLADAEGHLYLGQ